MKKIGYISIIFWSIVIFCSIVWSIVNINKNIKELQDIINHQNNEIQDLWQSIYALDEQYIVLFQEIYNVNEE